MVGILLSFMVVLIVLDLIEVLVSIASGLIEGLDLIALDLTEASGLMVDLDFMIHFFTMALGIMILSFMVVSTILDFVVVLSLVHQDSILSHELIREEVVDLMAIDLLAADLEWPQIQII
jgi:hypothetical protein